MNNDNPNMKEPAKSDTTGPSPEEESIKGDGTVDALEGLLDAGRADPYAQPQAAELSALLTSLIALVKSMSVSVKACEARIAEMTRDIGRLKTDDKVLTDMSAQCRKLREQHHERNVLLPMFLALIGVADRCRQAVGRLRTLLEKHANRAAAPAMRAVRQILEARNADRIDVENLLDNYAVEPFEHPDDTFEPTVQKCFRREPCEDNSRHGHVAERLLPGYRRFDRIIRREYVSVYATGGRDGRLSQGEQK